MSLTGPQRAFRSSSVSRSATRSCRALFSVMRFTNKESQSFIPAVLIHVDASSTGLMVVGRRQNQRSGLGAAAGEAEMSFCHTRRGKSELPLSLNLTSESLQLVNFNVPALHSGQNHRIIPLVRDWQCSHTIVKKKKIYFKAIEIYVCHQIYRFSANEAYFLPVPSLS